MVVGDLWAWVMAKSFADRVLFGVSGVVRSAVFVLAVHRRVQRTPRRVPACPPCYVHRCRMEGAISLLGFLSK